MKWLFPRTVIWAPLLFSGAFSLSVAQAADVVTEPERCVFLGVPYQCAFLEEEHLFLMANGGGVYAFDTLSGEQRWHRYLVSANGNQAAVFDGSQVLAWSEQGVFLLDAATGREVWWRRESQLGRTNSAHLSPDKNRVLVCGEQGSRLYGLKDRSQRALASMYGFHGWFTGGQSFLFFRYESVEERRVRKWNVMDADTGTVTPCFEEPYSWEEPMPSFSTGGQLVHLSVDEQGAGTLVIRDARTGGTVREFKNTDRLSRGVMWLRDGTQIFCLTEDRREARVVNPETGAVELALSGEGHLFLPRPPFTDANGAVWVFSRDGNNSIHAWKLVSGGAPQKMIDGARLAPGNFYFDRSQPGRLSVMGMEEERLWVYAVYALEDMAKLAAWRCRVPKQLYGGFLVNRALTHGVASFTVREDGYNRPANRRFGMYVQGREEPVRSGRGNVMAVSPDARYLAVQTEDRQACLYDAETDRVAAVYSVREDEEGQRYMNAVFSDDGKRLAVNTTEAVEVTELSDGFPRRTLASNRNTRSYSLILRFSPDGTRLLEGGVNCAWLHDAASGALLHTFEETERFANRYSYRGGGFLSSLAESAKDWAGLLTDRFKQGEMVGVTFVEDGARVVTHTAGQVIRVWDAESGRMLRSVHTELPEKRNGDGRINNQIMVSENGRFAFAANADGFSPAALWSLDDGALLRKYELPASSWINGVPLADGTAVYVMTNANLYRWSGAPEEYRDSAAAPPR